jgi:esterase/lipase superfamily enzyme
LPYHYRDDKEDAIRSGKNLGRSFNKVVDFMQEFLVRGKHQPCHRKIHLMVHSMGNRVLKYMMQNLNQRVELFSEIILVAADIEYDIFEQPGEFNNLIDLGQRIHIYYHKRDIVLDISKWTKNFTNQLGRYGRKRCDKTIPDIVDVDVSNSKDDKGEGISADKLNHWYYYSSTEVVNDIVRVLNDQNSTFKP